MKDQLVAEELHEERILFIFRHLPKNEKFILGALCASAVKNEF
jgi:hypothetical protein